MGRAVALDHELLFAANEINEIRSDRLLSNEFEPAEKAESKPPPESAFGLALVFAQFTRSSRFVQAHSAH